MATDREFVEALRRAAEHLTGRQITRPELDGIIDRFRKSTKPTTRGRAFEALDGLWPLTEGQTKAASDNADRVIRDLENVIDDWDPGT